MGQCFARRRTPLDPASELDAALDVGHVRAVEKKRRVRATAWEARPPSSPDAAHIFIVQLADLETGDEDRLYRTINSLRRILEREGLYISHIRHRLTSKGNVVEARIWKE